ncbi:conserved protein of unknown function [Pseudomonas marincola]|uniref:DUF1835 domain-containing protein n=1 Tax=Pseudomonas marincola TaxID=437900 RepID=A0A653E5D0_9PSED|nr:DUF1835 domain-containing protein [Pseudomonas marincola]CAE6885876.1 conserved protein of unknown function [Pseudomonas marincola]
MWHLTCGDLAAESIKPLLDEQAAKTLRVMRDDLAVGPLHDVDAAPCAARAAFWQKVWPQSVQPQPDFCSTLSEDAKWLAALNQQTQAVTVWHGDSCSEQLLLARVAAALEHSQATLFEVACGSSDSRVATRKAVSMRAPQELVALYQPKRIAADRQQQLAAQWRAVLADSSGVRRWQHGQFSGEDYTATDQRLLHFAQAQWLPLTRVMACVMAECDGFFATDFFLWWRVRELAANGQLLLASPPEQNLAEQQVKRA